jgi:hypothetical protein
VRATPTVLRKRRLKLDSESKPTSHATSITGSSPASSSSFARATRSAIRYWPGPIPSCALNIREKWKGL